MMHHQVLDLLHSIQYKLSVAESGDGRDAPGSPDSVTGAGKYADDGMTSCYVGFGFDMEFFVDGRDSTCCG